MLNQKINNLSFHRHFSFHNFLILPSSHTKAHLQTFPHISFQIHLQSLKCIFSFRSFYFFSYLFHLFYTTIDYMCIIANSKINLRSCGLKMNNVKTLFYFFFYLKKMKNDEIEHETDNQATNCAFVLSYKILADARKQR